MDGAQVLPERVVMSLGTCIYRVCAILQKKGKNLCTCVVLLSVASLALQVVAPTHSATKCNVRAKFMRSRVIATELFANETGDQEGRQSCDLVLNRQALNTQLVYLVFFANLNDHINP
jgi:hypothetical protein